ncbi:MAG TPA: ATP-binding protein [Polyangiales bacterium]|nr:ATP-binding protein [Polyangiales bacterium]
MTGGPGAGKTTVWRAFVEAHASDVCAVPEVATLMLSHVFPGIDSDVQRCALQRSIFALQHNLEAYHADRSPGLALVCDRGTPDGGGYWPDGHRAFFSAMQCDWDTELARYDAVLFLETAAAAGLSIASDNATRTEDLQTALAIDRRLHDVWSKHPRFHHVPVEDRFASKVQHGLATLEKLLGELK